MKSEDIDLRDEVQYLRELVEALMKELKESRETSQFPQSYPVYIPMLPEPMRINPPAWWIDHNQWFTTTAGTNNFTVAYSPSSFTLTNNAWTGTNG